MKMLVGLVASFLVVQVMASDFYGELRSFNLNYQQPSGTANSEHFIFQDIAFENPTQYLVELQAGSLFLETPESTIQIDDLPNFVTDVDSLVITNLNLLSNTAAITLGVDEFHTVSRDGSMKVEALNALCANLTSSPDVLFDLLDRCLNMRGEISIDSVYEGTDKKLAHFTMETQGGRMTFRVTAEGKTVRGEGETYFVDNKIRIKITKAKYGILSVRGLLFRKLADLANDNVTVNNPWIEVNL